MLDLLPAETVTPPQRRRGQRKTVLVADLFCGAGGSSTGAKRALESMGFEMDLVCVNHWDTAIETHRKNHPAARHYCEDVSTVRPLEAVPEGRLDLLMASPTCTFHSRARGGRPMSDQQRMDPWQVIAWLSQIRVKRLLVENVPEYVRWGPVDIRTGRPIKSREGEYFLAWLQALTAHGFKYEWRKIVCADYGDATTRERFILMGRSDGKPIIWPEPTHSKTGGTDLFGSRKKWRSAREIIDWSLKGRSIFDRPKPLATKTLARILAGAIKEGWPEVLVAILRRYMEGTSEPLPSIKGQVADVLRQHADGDGQASIVVLRQHMDGRSVDEPLSTITASGNHFGIAQTSLTPILLGQQSCAAPRSADEPLPTISTAGAISLTQPVVIVMKGRSDARSIERPVSTITNIPCLGVAEPMLAPYYGDGSGKTCASVDVPVPTITTVDRFGLVEPVAEPIVIQTDQTGGGGSPRTIDEPLRTVVTKQNQAVVEAVIAASAQDEHLAKAIAQGRVVEIDGQLRIFDIRFRMLEPYELARAMGFSDGEAEYEFVGSKADQTKQVGNAVPVGTATALVSAAFSV